MVSCNLIKARLFKSCWIIAFKILSRTQLPKIFTSFRQIIGPKLYFDSTKLLLSSLNIKKNYSVLIYHCIQQLTLVNQRILMNFVLNPNSLPFNTHQKKSEGLQYYEWRYKQKLHQQEQDLKSIKKYEKMIQNEQQQAGKQNIYKKRMHHQGNFYDYNLSWKKRVENKIDEERVNKQMEINKQQQKGMRSELMEQKKQLNRDYQGPVQGWQKHFQNYLKNKSSSLQPTSQLTFEPKINERSRKMAEGMTGKVEDRLILFGQFLKIKNLQEKNKTNSQFGQPMLISQKYASNTSNQSELFYRLYKQGEQANRKRRQLTMYQQHSFQPRLNKLPEQIEDKIMKRRKPLYYVKNQISNSSSDQNLSQQNQRKKNHRGDFNAFLKRNQALLDHKKKMMLTLRQKQQQEQKLEISHCTFTPILNNYSKKLNKEVQESNKAFESKMLNNISLAQDQSHINPIQNIDISKLTIPDAKQSSRIDDLDSLSIYKMQPQAKPILKSEFYQTSTLTSNQKHSRIEQMSQGTYRVNQQKEVRYQNSMVVEPNVEQDSIQKMRSNQWQNQLESIQSNLQNMMIRASQMNK